VDEMDRRRRKDYEPISNSFLMLLLLTGYALILGFAHLFLVHLHEKYLIFVRGMDDVVLLIDCLCRL
jgi:hypothetical protein